MCVLKWFFSLFVFTSFVNRVYGIDKSALEKYSLFNIFLYSPMMQCSHNRNLNLDVGGITVYFYDFTNNFITSFPIENAAENILSINSLDKKKKFIMFVGGFTSHINKEHVQLIRQAYSTYPDSYLIIPDHSPYTNDMNGYPNAVTHVYFIGKALGKMWAELKEGGISPKNVHCVGHSLGGHILGHVGETFYHLTGEKISRITALDPAGPCFSSSSIQNQVRSGVADYVEVFHCNPGVLGSSRILGDVDYIVTVNRKTHAGCTYIFDPFTADCHHKVCIYLWTASVKNKKLFPAYNRFYKFTKSQSDKTIAGAWGPATAKGIYYLSTAGYDLIALR